MDKEAMLEYLDKYMKYIRTIDVNVFKDINDPGNRVPLRMSGTLVQLMRVYGILEGICKELDPQFNYFDLMDDQANNLLLDDSFLEYKIQRDMRTMEQRVLKALFNFFA
jgi:predicted unusual protein kinase regulating ubiquinone biosynthesis (AarF/ABC1/UbiB family)